MCTQERVRRRCDSTYFFCPNYLWCVTYVTGCDNVKLIFFKKKNVLKVCSWSRENTCQWSQTCKAGERWPFCEQGRYVLTYGNIISSLIELVTWIFLNALKPFVKLLFSLHWDLEKTFQSKRINRNFSVTGKCKMQRWLRNSWWKQRFKG